MGRVSEVLCAATSSNAVYLAALDKDQLYLIRSSRTPSSLADAKWEVFSKEPLKDVPNLSSNDVSCAAGDDESFVIMGLRRFSEAGGHSTFWGATYHYGYENTWRSKWVMATSSMTCLPTDSCNHMVLAARSRLDYQQKYIHLVYRNTTNSTSQVFPHIELSPFIENGFKDYTSPISVNPPLKELALFTYYQGALTSLRIAANETSNTVSLNVQSFAVDMMGVPLPNNAPIASTTMELQQYCYLEEATIGKLGGVSGDKLYFWCQSYRNNYGVYEFNGTNLTKVADVPRVSDAYGARAYLPAPSVEKAYVSSSFDAPTWGLVLRDSKVYAINQGSGSSTNGGGSWQNSGDAFSFEVDGFGDGNGLSRLAIGLITAGSVLFLALSVSLGLWWYWRRQPKLEPTLEEGTYFDGDYPPIDQLDQEPPYASPWVSVRSLPPPYAPPHGEEQTEGEGGEAEDDNEEESSQGNEESEHGADENSVDEPLEQENPREPPPSEETLDGRSSQESRHESSIAPRRRSESHEMRSF